MLFDLTHGLAVLKRLSEKYVADLNIVPDCSDCTTMRAESTENYVAVLIVVLKRIVKL